MSRHIKGESGILLKKTTVLAKSLLASFQQARQDGRRYVLVVQSIKNIVKNILFNP